MCVCVCLGAQKMTRDVLKLEFQAAAKCDHGVGDGTQS